jgi:fructose-1,6-bisphosphatase/inositol monophosphatase family enzyme
LNRLARRVKKIRIMGSAALELAYVSSGRLDAYIERTDQFVGRGGGTACSWKMPAVNFMRCPRRMANMRMCASNGKMRKKLQIGSLLK